MSEQEIRSPEVVDNILDAIPDDSDGKRYCWSSVCACLGCVRHLVSGTEWWSYLDRHPKFQIKIYEKKIAREQSSIDWMKEQINTLRLRLNEEERGERG